MDQKTVMISGASRGIGQAIAAAFLADQNYFLSLGVRDKADQHREGLFPQDKNKIAYFPYEARDSQLAQHWVEGTVRQCGAIDVLINCAGIFRTCGIDHFDAASLEEMWQVNAKAPVILTEAAWPYLKKSKQGRIINIASIAGKLTRASEFGYNMSKHALMSFSHSIRQAGHPHGIRVTAVCPGWVNTEMAEVSPLSPEQMTQPEDIASLVKSIVELPNTASVADLTVNGESGVLY